VEGEERKSPASYWLRHPLPSRNSHRIEHHL
jgi:hypothetical protein